MSFSSLLWMTGLVVLASMGVAYRRSRDPLHPLMYLGPMLFYIYAFLPLVYHSQGLLVDFFPDEAKLARAQLYLFAGVAFFCWGCLLPRPPAQAGQVVRLPTVFRAETRRRMELMSYLLGGAALLAYAYSLQQAGGFLASYSRAKGGGVTTGLSGYITGAPLLAIPATLMYVLSQKGHPSGIRTAAVAILIMSPHLIQGTLGGSRGAMFLSGVTLIVSWYLARARRPALMPIVSALAVVGVLMLFLQAHRRQLYLGSEFDVERVSLRELLLPTQLSMNDATTYSWGLVLASEYNQFHYWGRRYATQLFIRPIPRQIWPTKYEDVGMGWMVGRPGSGGMLPSQWRRALGWIPEAGTAAGFVADSFLEFAWGGLVVCFVLGWFYGWLWKQAVVVKDVWLVIYFEACVVSVYLPTQGVTSAWFYRFSYLAGVTLIAWLVLKRYQHRLAETARRFARPAMPPARQQAGG